MEERRQSLVSVKSLCMYATALCTHAGMVTGRDDITGVASNTRFSLPQTPPPLGYEAVRLGLYWNPHSPSGTAFTDTLVHPPDALKSDQSLKCGCALWVSTAAAST